MSEDKPEGTDEVTEEETSPSSPEDVTEDTADASPEDAETDLPVESEGESEAVDPLDLMNAEAVILSEKLGPLGVFDRGVYKLEVVIVVTALILMSITVFTDVVYQLVVSFQQALSRGETSVYTTIGGILAFIGLMAFAATGSNAVHDPDADVDDDEPTEASPLPVRIGVVVGTLVVTIVFSWALVSLESTTVYRILLVAILAPVIYQLAQSGKTQAAGVLGVAGLISLYLFGSLPTGYSWAQSYSLLLLLWVGFLGASIAARERRHLRVDLARKLLPPDKVAAFNAVSYLVAAGFTGVVLYLGYVYMFGPDSTYLRPIWEAPAWLPESTQQMLTQEFPLPDDAGFFRRLLQVIFSPSEPGEIPDWLKVMAIPVSMALVALRFLGHAFVFARMAMRGESFTEQAGAH